MKEFLPKRKEKKFDYFSDAVYLIYNSNKITDTEKHRMVENILYIYTKHKIFDKKSFEYFKKKLESIE